MQTIQQAPEYLSPKLPRREPTDAEIRATLHDILQSQPFRTSKQCQDLLSYIVDHSLHGDDASLRERILGIEVFGRAADYDTSEDPVVRMRAADVRKRLAQFYQSIEPDSPLHAASHPEVVHFELRPGSYRVTFHYENPAREEQGSDHLHASQQVGARQQGKSPVLAVANTPEPAHEIRLPDVVTPVAPDALHTTLRRRFGVREALVASVFVLLLAFAGWKAWLWHSITPQQLFWAPLTRAGQPVLVYVGSNAVYRFTPEYLARYKKEHGIVKNGPEFFVDLPKGGTIQADDLMANKDCFVSVADLAAAAQVVSLLRGWDKPFNLRSAEDMTIGDIRNNPSVLIGAFNDNWTLEATNDLPYSFRDGVRIVSRDKPGQSWTVATGEKVVSINKAYATEDYALISRLQHSNTGGPVLSVGGIGSFGTQAAAEFVTSSEKMNDLLKSAPVGWEGKNMQAVLRIKVVGYAPVAVDVVATSYW